MSPTAIPLPVRRRAAVRATAVLAMAVAAIGYLHRLADEPWARIDVDAPAAWLATTPAEDVVAALLRLAALSLCWWVAGSLVLAVAARVAGWRPVVVAADRLSPGSLRRLADGLTGGTLLVATVLGPTAPALGSEPSEPAVPASSAFSPPGAVPIAPPTGTPAPTTTPPPASTPAPTTTPATAPTPSGVPNAPGTPAPRPRPASPRPAAPAAADRDDLVEVRPGDHLWSIARQAVAAQRGVPVDAVTAADVAPYWRRVVSANRDRLRSGDPDLVLPGETVLLPEWRP